MSSPPDADEREALLLPPEGSAPDANRLSSPFAFARRWRKGAVPCTVAGSVALLALLGLAGFDFASRAERAADGGPGRDGRFAAAGTYFAVVQAAGRSWSSRLVLTR